MYLFNFIQVGSYGRVDLICIQVQIGLGVTIPSLPFHWVRKLVYSSKTGRQGCQDTELAPRGDVLRFHSIPTQVVELESGIRQVVEPIFGHCAHQVWCQLHQSGRRHRSLVQQLCHQRSPLLLQMIWSTLVNPLQVKLQKHSTGKEWVLAGVWRDKFARHVDLNKQPWRIRGTKKLSTNGTPVRKTAYKLMFNHWQMKDYIIQNIVN